MSPNPATARLLSAALFLALLATPGAAQSAAGRLDVWNSRGEVSPLAGTVIESETLSEVRFHRTGSSRSESRKTELVVQVVYGKGSPNYESGLQALADGNLKQAIDFFERATADNEPPWVAALARLEHAEALAKLGDVPAARESLGRFFKDHGKHRLLPRALLLESRLASRGADPSAADAALQAVLKLVAENKVTPDWAARAHLGKGNDLLDAGDAEAATAAFQAAADAARSGRSALEKRPDLEPALDRLALQARSGTGAAMLAAGDLVAARAFFEALERDGHDNAAIRAAARNGKAEADFHDEGRLKEAQMGFARVAVTAGAVPDEHAKALYYLGRCSLSLAEAGQEKNGRSKARQYFKDVELRYPDTRWARLARESLP